MMMKRAHFILLIVILTAVMLLQSCSDTDSAPESDDARIVGTLVSQLSDAGNSLENYDKNMELFGGYMKNVYAYECVYRYSLTDDRIIAYEGAIELKTKLYYAVMHDYYLTEDEIDRVRNNAENYLRMQYDTLSLDVEYSSDTVANEIFGISAEQYIMIRLCESLSEKCVSDMIYEYENDRPPNASALREYYSDKKDMYDYAVIRYISYRLDPGGDEAVNKEIAESAQGFMDTLVTIDDMLDVIGEESDIQTVGSSNGQVSVYMNDTGSLFRELAGRADKEENAKMLVFDSENVYVAMCEGFFSFDSSTAVFENVKGDYIRNAVEAEMLENRLEYSEADGW